MEKKDWRGDLLKIGEIPDGSEETVFVEFHLDTLNDFIKKVVDKAREEGARDVFTKDEWFMLKLAMNDIFNGGNRAYEDISNKIKSQLSKLTTK